MVERWARFYGMASAREICAFNQQPPPTTIRLVADTDGNTQPAEDALAAEGITLAPAAFLTRARTVLHGDVTATETYRTGKVRIQDEGSQLVAELAGQGTRILDCCAAPGGKTAILAERNPNATLLACDVSSRRLDQMKRLLQTPQADSRPSQITYHVADIANVNREGQFDLVLCDVPCSGTGTLARNPEIRHRITPEAIPRHHQRQVEILRAAMRAVAPDGRLVYATCSLEPEENEAVIEAALKAAGAEPASFSRVPFDLAALVEANIVRPEAEPHLRETAFPNNTLRTIPGVHPCDGFFAAMLVKN
jgi:16S rRNA (cytosine967-C5)-methyltransferase